MKLLITLILVVVGVIELLFSPRIDITEENIFVWITTTNKNKRILLFKI